MVCELFEPTEKQILAWDFTFTLGSTQTYIHSIRRVLMVLWVYQCQFTLSTLQKIWVFASSCRYLQVSIPLDMVANLFLKDWVEYLVPITVIARWSLESCSRRYDLLFKDGALYVKNIGQGLCCMNSCFFSTYAGEVTTCSLTPKVLKCSS